MKKKILYISWGALLVVLSTSSCDNFFNCLEGNGILEKETRVVSEFMGVENNTSFDVDVYSNSEFSVSVSADENLLPYIRTYISGGNLVVDIENNKCFKENTGITVKVAMPEIDQVYLHGSGSINVSSFNCSNIEVINTGSGDIDLRNFVISNSLNLQLSGSGTIFIDGKTKTGTYNLSGSGDIIADDMQTSEAFVTSTGSGDMYCFAYDYLEATIAGSGDIFYSGSPALSFTDNGSGDIYKRN